MVVWIATHLVLKRIYENLEEKLLGKPEGTIRRTMEKGQECYEFSLYNLSERQEGVCGGQGLAFLCVTLLEHVK